jgi:argininosuccinate lyase
MSAYIVRMMEVNEYILEGPRYDLIFSVEEVNRLATEGLPFRDAYKKVGLDIEAGNFTPDKDIHHTHEGSIGNLCTKEIAALMDSLVEDFHFERIDKAVEALLA